MKARFALILLVLAGLAWPVLEQVAARPAAAQTTPNSFKAEGEPAPVGPGGDLASVKRALESCRETVELDKKDETGMGYLTAAYLALWGILLIFFVFVQVRQSRLRAEMQELRARLARLGGGS